MSSPASAAGPSSSARPRTAPGIRGTSASAASTSSGRRRRHRRNGHRCLDRRRRGPDRAARPAPPAVRPAGCGGRPDPRPRPSPASPRPRPRVGSAARQVEPPDGLLATFFGRLADRRDVTRHAFGGARPGCRTAAARPARRSRPAPARPAPARARHRTEADPEHPRSGDAVLAEHSGRVDRLLGDRSPAVVDRRLGLAPAGPVVGDDLPAAGEPVERPARTRPTRSRSAWISRTAGPSPRETEWSRSAARDPVSAGPGGLPAPGSPPRGRRSGSRRGPGSPARRCRRSARAG